MSAMPPTQQRSRTMGSDITKLFRSVSSLQPKSDKIPSTASTSTLETSTPVASKKKITRIPLFGRPRKKSNHSASSGPYSSTGLVRESTDVEGTSSRAPSPERHRRPSGVSLMVPGPSNKQSTSSFTKFAAHFSPSQSKKSISSSNLLLSSSQSSLPTSSAHPPSSNRPSCESGSSAGSRTRSTTPRGTRPVIRVSMTDNLDEYKDLFAQDVYLRPSSKAALKQTSGTAQDSDLTPSPSPSVPHSPEPTVYKRGQTPASILAAAIRDQQVHKRQTSTSSKNSRQTPESERSSGNDKDEGKSIPRLSAAAARESPRLFQVPGEKGLAPSLSSRRGSVVSSVQSTDNASLRSRIKPPGNAARSKPPSIPLPDLPPMTPPSRNLSPTNLDGFDLSGDDSRATIPVRPGRRPRAHTISSLPELPINAPGSPDMGDNKMPSDVPGLEDDENVDIDSASAVQLRRALRSRNKQFEELAAFTLKKEEQWSAERKNLEKKISSLHRELVRRESEITGLKLIISEDDILKRPKPLPAGILNQSRLSSVSTSPSPSYSDYDSRGSRRLINYQSDSGAESPRGSGTESVSSILRNNHHNNNKKKTHQRSSAIGEFNYMVRTSSSSIMRQPKFPPGLLHDKAAATESPYSKRMSLLSMTSASSSGSSSLIPPSPSMTMSSLSAIPEGPSSGLQVEENDAAGEEGRARRVSHRISASSIASSSAATTAASSVYSNSNMNMKRSRPPSIAQVLEKSPTNMDDVLEKLRPFA